MSGGHFSYQQYKIGYIADEIEQLIIDNDSEELNDWGVQRGAGYRPEVVAEFKNAVYFLRLAQIYAQRVDWLVSDDDGEDSFIRRLNDEIEKLNEQRVS